MNINFEKVEKVWFKPKKTFDEYIDKQCDYYRQYKTDYEYFKTLFSKSTKEDVLVALTEKCEELQRLHITHFKLAVKEHVENNIISELEEWLKDIRINNAQIDEWTIMEVQLKIQKLKKGE